MSPRTPSSESRYRTCMAAKDTAAYDRSPARPAARISSACWRLTSIRERPKACSRSMAGAPGPSGGGPSITSRWNSVSDRFSSAAISPSRLSNLRNTVPLPTPASAATLSMVTASTPQCSTSRAAAASSASRLRAASLRSRGGWSSRGSRSNTRSA